MSSNKSVNTYKIKEEKEKEKPSIDDSNLEDKVTFRIPNQLKAKLEKSMKKGEFETKSQLIRTALKEFYQKTN